MKFPNLPAASALTGAEIMPLTQGGTDKRTTAQDVADLALPDADAVAYDNATSGLTADDVQAAIDEIVASPPAPEADDVPYDNATSGLAATDVQAAIDEIAGATTSPTQAIIIACSDETTNLTTGAAKVTFRIPYAFTLTGVRASLKTAQSAGSVFTVDINEAGTSILSTKLTIDNGEKTSTTAATPAVISDTSIADDAEITIDIDQVGTALAKGLKVALIGHPT
jgi:hypothetical protein